MELEVFLRFPMCTIELLSYAYRRIFKHSPVFTLSKLEDLLKDILGAVGVGEFSDDGKLLFYTDNLKEQAAEYSAMLCAAVKQLASTMAKGWDMYSGQEGFYPILGFTMGCGKHAAMVMGNIAVFAELEKADLDKTFEIMPNYV